MLGNTTEGAWPVVKRLDELLLDVGRALLTRGSVLARRTRGCIVRPCASVCLLLAALVACWPRSSRPAAATTSAADDPSQRATRRPDRGRR